MTLAGQTLFLSASVPSPQREAEYHRIPDAAQQIDHAVVSLCRALFSRGGSIVFGGHPSISPLVALVAAEYAGPETSSKPMALIYQSRIFEGHLPDETLLMYRLGYAELHWIDGAPGEKFDPLDPSSLLRIGGSLKSMREAMIGETNPVAMVAIGEMKGVLDEAEIFQRLRHSPIFVLESTGGASVILAERGDGGIRVYDREIRQRLGESAPARTPYGLITQLLVDELEKPPIT
jgi:SLOG cluster3 family